MVLRFYLVALLFGWVTTCCHGQCLSGKEQQIWAYRLTLFDFSTLPPAVNPYPSNGGFELNSQWCDANGVLQLYMHGARVYNRNHQLMPKGNLRIANAPSSTHGIILPWPGSDSLYFVFAPESNDSHDDPKTLYYAVVDMSLDGGLGGVEGVSSIYPDTFPLLRMSSDRVAVVKHCNGRDWWLLGRSADSNTWYAWPITPDGIQPPVISQVGFQTQFQTGGNCSSSPGQLHISPDGRRVAIAYEQNLCLNGSHLVVELLDFSTSTGVLINARTVTESPIAGYGVQFSPDNAKLYFSRLQNNFTGGEILQVDLLTPTLNTVRIFPAVDTPALKINGYSGLATGPDGRIYASDWPQSWLHIIADPNEAGDACNFIWQGLDISPGTSGLGLPTMPTGHWRPYAPWLSGQRRPHPCDTLTYTVSHTCSADTWTEWSYRGANTLLSEDADSVRIAFHTPGTDTLIATRHSPCDVVSDTLFLQVQPSPVLTASLSDSLLCPGRIATLIITPEATTRGLLLPDGSVMSNLPDTLALGPITEDACYTLNLGAEGACDTIFSFCLRSLSTASTIDTLIRCIGESAEIHGSPVSTPGTYDMTYSAANGCDSLSSVTLQIISTPEVVADVSPPTCAGLSDGYILLDAGPGMSYVWNDGADISSRQNLPAGNYMVTVSAGGSCDTVLTFVLTAPPEVSVFLPSSSTVLAGDSLHLQPLIQPPGAYTYIWTPKEGLSCADCPDPIAAPTSTTAYTLIVTDALGCTYPAGTLIEVRDPETPVQRIYFPTAFSPNEDGINDTWQILGSEDLFIRRLEVFDRWGNLVHACAELPPSLCIWDGTTLGKKSPAGIYVWQIELTLPDGSLLKRKGEMMLVR